MAPLQINTRQLIAAAIVAALGLLVASTPSLHTLGAIAGVAFVAAFAILLGGGGASVPQGLVDAVRRAGSGERTPPPPHAPAEIAAAYDELGRLAETLRAGKGDVEKARDDQRRAVDEETKKREELREELRSLRDELRRSQEDVRKAQADVSSARELATQQTLQMRDLDARRKLELDDVLGRLDEQNRKLAETIAAELSVAEDAGRRVREVTHALKEIATSVEQLASAAEESSSSILELTATNDEVAENVGELASSVRETVSSIEEMTYSIKEVAKNVDALSLTAEETSSSMNEMDVSIDQVQSNANETAKLSEEVASDAERGAESILKTIGEIYRIKESSQEAVAVISNLGSRIEAIGQILSVIDDVAEQTNLLALNAAIIAAQAGEHGKGFAVVADEIKDLAERAGSSTKEIAELIKTIQAESKNAVAAVERGAHNVDRGVEVSNEAERALKKILESSQKSTTMVRAIARATVEQAKGSKQVTDAIGRIAETVQQIAAATAQQARGSELIVKSAEKMRLITQHVERSSQEQARGGRQITSAIEQISNMVNQLNAAHRGQTRGNEQLLSSADRLDEIVRAHEQTARQVQTALDRFRRALEAP
jgi:methyl-accepting chemotaxis protein